MQGSVARRLGTLEGFETAITPLRVTCHRPSVWEQAKVWAKTETIAETVLVTATALLMGGLYYSLYQALQNYMVL